MKGTLSPGDCILSADPNATYSDPVMEGTRRCGESGWSVVQNEGWSPTPPAKRSLRFAIVTTTERAPMQ
jgi:hypothetical protein